MHATHQQELPVGEIDGHLWPKIPSVRRLPVDWQLLEHSGDETELVEEAEKLLRQPRQQPILEILALGLEL